MRKLIGTKQFYKMVLIVVLPIIVQNTISNFVSLLDNIMVGVVGEAEMTGVSIVNQLQFVYNLCVFGGIAGAGIFSAQYHGAGNPQGVRDCLRYKLYLSIGLTAAALVVFIFFGEQLIGLYLNETERVDEAAKTLQYGKDYLSVIMWGMLPFALTQAYAGTLRETGETGMPMRAGIVAVLTNMVLNYTFIYGHFGAPEMGVKGAALATVISRYVELAIIAFLTHRNTLRYKFADGLYKSGHIPMALVKKIAVKGTPLLLNEAIWSFAVSAVAQCYSQRGLNVVTALNISNTVSNLFNVVLFSMGSAVSIILGQELGANEVKEARTHSLQLSAFAVALCAVTALLLAASSKYIPLIYNASDDVHALATKFMLIVAVYMPVNSLVNTSYFTIRSGGRTFITFLFDCVFECALSFPLAKLLVTITNWDIIVIYAIVQGLMIIKCVIGVIMVKKGIWIKNIVE